MTFHIKGRISKTYQGKTTRWVWDGNVPLHEWTEEEKRGGAGDENLITWLFEESSFVPCAKLQNGESYSIVTDYLGTPTHAFDCNGAKVWERNLDIYGKIRTGNSTFVPFLYQGQYFDAEIDLCYNRFRYYDPNLGNYISQDPIGLNGGDRLYAFVHDPNGWVDVFGLAKRGPKTGGVGPHNEAIKAWGDEVIADGGTIIHGGGYEKEKLFETPGGHKSARRPDIIWKDADGKVHWGNVGKTNAVGKPVKREILAMQDLNKIRHANGVLDRVHFRSYNYPETNKKTKKPKSSCH